MTTLTEERDADVIARSVQPGRFHVLIAGAGPAGVEAALRLQRIAGDRIRTTIVAPDERFVHLPPTVLEPFAVGCADAPPLGALAASAGARLHRGTVVSVDPLAREVHLHDGDTLRYDALLIAVGGRQRSPYPRALAFGTAGSEERMHGVIQDVEGGYIRRLAFVVPPGASWPLPVYELALLTAERAFEMCVDVEVTLVTPEPFALALFGADVSQDLARLLAAADITVKANTVAEMPRWNALELRPSGELLEVDRVVTVPVLTGPAIGGLPYDGTGFLPVDAHGRVAGAPGVYAAGDATDFEIKQGGIACQQTDAAADAIAALAGVPIDPTPFAPILRGMLLTERDSRWLERDLGRASGVEGRVGESSPDWPRTKFVGRELSRLLADVGRRGAHAR
jgi:sulfide:quinone oxidoreductase